jgi:hypothetical protein
MTAGELTLRPLLRRYPDARRAKAPLLQPALLPYLALLFGSSVAALVAVYNALMLRRPALALRSLLIGVAGWVSFFLIIASANANAHVRVVMILGRALHFAFGGVLYAMHRRHFTGSQFLDGPALPLVKSYVAAVVLYFIFPSAVVALLLGVPPG